MRFHRAVNLLVLAAFLPLATGCSTQRTRTLGSDPGDADVWFPAEEPVRIAGYTDREGQFNEWEGEVRAVLPDSLQFTRAVPEGYWPHPDSAFRPSHPEVLRLHRSDVLSVELVEFDKQKTNALVLGFIAVILAMTAAAIVVASQMDMDFKIGDE